MNEKIIIFFCILFFIVIVLSLIILVRKKHSEPNSTFLLKKLQDQLIDHYDPGEDTQNINKKIGDIPIYYINLDESKDRREFMVKQEEFYKIKLTRISGVNGKIKNYKMDTITMDDNSEIPFVNNNYSENNGGELGCTLSHIKAILTAYRNGDELALIVEDDISFSLSPYWPINIDTIIRKAPLDWTMITLHSNSCKRINSDYKLFDVDNPCWSTVSYLINREGMKNVLRDILSSGKIILDRNISLNSYSSLAADVLIYHRGIKSYHYIGHPLFFEYNDIDLMDSTIHTDHTPDHIRRSIENISSYVIENKGDIIIKKCFSCDTPIPKIIHQTWKEKELPDNFKTWSEECKQLHQDWTYKLWTDEDNREFIRMEFPWFLHTYDNYDKHIKRVDAVRYFLLFKYGGVYMDMDFLCLKNITPLLEDGKAIFGYQLKDKNEEGAIANAFMAAPPMHPLFENIIHSLKYNTEGNVLDCTGPRFLTRQIKKYIGTDIVIHEMPIIYTHEWNEDGKKVRDCSVDTNKCREHFPESYTSTVWTHTWW